VVTDDPREVALRGRFDVTETEIAVGDETVRLLRPASADALISEADFAVDERLPYWADVWPSSIVLAGHVRAMAGAGRTLLELGCGLGLVATSATLAGFDVLATDYYEDALRFAELNVERNAGRPLRAMHLDWRDLPDELPQFDVVVASDVLYELQYAELVADIVRRTLKPEGEGWIADPGRLASGPFLDECARRGIQHETAAEVPWVDGAIRQTIRLHRLWWPRVAARPAVVAAGRPA
jgi:predicted nicotinamide N-methyase